MTRDRYAVVDTETTGMDPKDSTLVEVGVVRESGDMRQSLVCPGDIRISYGAMATHHITQEMVADAPSAVEALWEVGLGPPSAPCLECEGTGSIEEPYIADDGVTSARSVSCTECHNGFVQASPDYAAPDVLVFHNAQFDRGFLPEWLRELPYVCTWKCALHLVPDAESHSNGALWYELGLSHPMPPEAGLMPHRALFDAIMTRDIVEYFLSMTAFREKESDTGPMSPDEALAELVRLTQAPVLLKKCNFGKHVGERWEDIPTSYMNWVLGQDFDEDTKHTCRHWLKVRGRA